MRLNFVLICIFQIFLISCSHFNYKTIVKKKDPIQKNNIDSLLTVVKYQQTAIDSLENELDRSLFVIDSLFNSLEIANDRVAINQNFEIPLEITFAGVKISLHNERTYSKFLKIYNQELKNAPRYIPRSGTYFPVFDSIFTANKIPLDAKYLSVAESFLSPSATSWVGAAGLWQFMPRTAKGYNLIINDFIDERRNTIKSTQAAAKYLKDNHNYLKKLGTEDWLLTFCSYNAGAGSVGRVVKEQGGKNFQDLIMRVDETNKYLWRAIAIKLIFNNQKAIFGKEFKLKPSLISQTRSVKLHLEGHYKIDKWAKAQGTVVSKVWEYNPWIKIYKRKRSKYSPINDVVLPPGTFTIFLPKKSKSNKNEIAEIEKILSKKNSGYFQYHIVKKGESLFSISKKYRTSIKKIKNINNLKSDIIRPGQKLHLYSNSNNYNLSSKTYIVKTGDSISKIAMKLGITSNRLIVKNNLKRHKKNGQYYIHIVPGQKLKY